MLHKQNFLGKKPVSLSHETIAPSGLVAGVYQSDSIRGTALEKCFYGRNKSADTLKRFASVRTCASVNCRSPRRIIAPSVR